MKKLLFSVTKRDLRIEYFSGSGAGGQNRNKKMKCCRIFHPESGAMAIGTESKSQEQNRKQAFRRLAEIPKFKIWQKMKAGQMMVDNGEIEKRVEKGLKDILVEVRKDGEWVEEISA